jgi:excisionase family DNA binding protein
VPDELLTVDEVAAILKVNPQSVRNWLDRGDLSGVRVGKRRIRIRQSDLDRFLGGDETETEAAPTEDATIRDRSELALALAEARTQLEAGTDKALAAALRSLAAAATRLAVSLDRPGERHAP